MRDRKRRREFILEITNEKTMKVVRILHPQQTSSRSSDSLVRLYEMDDHPDRRVFLEKLLGFMEEKGTPITQCPTISKNPLDLFRLYLYTKERGGYLEVSALLKL